MKLVSITARLVLPGASAKPACLATTSTLTRNALNVTTVARAVRVLPSARGVRPEGSSTDPASALQTVTIAQKLVMANAIDVKWDTVTPSPNSARSLETVRMKEPKSHISSSYF